MFAVLIYSNALKFAFMASYALHNKMSYKLIFISITTIRKLFFQVGALGFVPRIVDFVYPVSIIRVDPDDPSIPFRDPTSGRCVACKPDEVIDDSICI